MRRPRRAGAICLATLALAACGGSPAGGGGTPDAHAGPDAVPVPCVAAVATQVTGTHNAGIACLGCHDGTGRPPKWTVAGTVLTPSGAPEVGATIAITDAAGQKLDLVSALNGNFYTRQSLTFPLTVYVSRCPDGQPMKAMVTDGNCNICHGVGAMQPAIHLP